MTATQQILGHVKKLKATKKTLSKLRDTLRTQVEEFSDLLASVEDAEEAMDSALRELDYAVARMSELL